ILEGQRGIPVQEPTKEQVQHWKGEVQKSIPPYMIPNDWVILERFPLTSNNKVDRKLLPKPFSAAASHVGDVRLPVTNGQKLVAKTWSKVLGVRSIELDDDFFDMGGHSLLAVEVMTHLEKETGKRIPLNSLFRYPTLEEFAELFEEEEEEEKASIETKDDSW